MDLYPLIEDMRVVVPAPFQGSRIMDDSESSLESMILLAKE